MKNIYNILTVGLLLYSSIIYAQNQKNGYHIIGQIKGLPEETNVHLIRTAKQKIDTISSTKSKGGKFQFIGQLPLDGELLYVRLDSNLSKKSIIFYAVNGSILLTGDLSTWPNGISVKGSLPQTDYEKLNSLLSIPYKEVKSINSEKTKLFVRMDSAKSRLLMIDTAKLRANIINNQQEVIKSLANYYKIWDEFINQHPNSLYTPQAILKRSNLTLKQLETSYGKLSEASRKSFYGYELKMKIERQKLSNLIKVGETAPDFISNTPEGNSLSLREIVSKGKLTLVDFWGSWCKPCRAEVPNLKMVYTAFHDKGFNIVGVAAETSIKSWKKAIMDDESPWIHVSTIQNREEPAYKIYEVNGVPAYILIDGAGKIVAIDLPGSKIPSAGGSLRGEELYKTVEKILEHSSKIH